MDKVLELAQKLKALAERGVGGEKTNAIAALEALLKKHNISEEELEDPITKRYRIYVPFKKRTIFNQVFKMIAGTQEMYILRSKPNTYVQELTALQFIEVEATFDFYWKAYEEELAIFEQAFIQKNQLFDPKGPVRELDELTPEEQAKARKMLAMADQIEKQKMDKRIEA